MIVDINYITFRRIVFFPFQVEIGKELGDVLWYNAIIANYLDIEFADIAQANLKKLASRKNRGKISGSGDNR